MKFKIIIVLTLLVFSCKPEYSKYKVRYYLNGVSKGEKVVEMADSLKPGQVIIRQYKDTVEGYLILKKIQ